MQPFFFAASVRIIFINQSFNKNNECHIIVFTCIIFCITHLFQAGI